MTPIRPIIHNLHVELPETGIRAGADSGDPRVRSASVFEQDSGLRVGAWECQPGGWPVPKRTDTETFVILQGRATLTDADGLSVPIAAGDLVVLPTGWEGRWDVTETLKKAFVIV